MLFRFGDFALDTDLLELKRDGELQSLEPQVFRVMAHLVENSDRVVSKDELIEEVWDGRIVSDATLNTSINALRRAVGDTGKSQAIIRTVPRRGFRFVAELIKDQKATETLIQSSIPTHFDSDRPSIAVLPFKLLSDETDQDYIAEGMVEEIITLLSSVPDLFVIARNSTISYRDHSPEPRQVAEDLGVRYVLQGSVRKADDRIRVTVRFVDAKNGNQIWAERYDRDLMDIFAVQDEVARGIVGALQSQLFAAESAYMNRKPAESLDAWGNVVKARIKMFAYRSEDINEAEPYARRALDIEPDYAPAHAVFSQILALQSYNGWTDDWLGAARASVNHANRAMDLEPHNPTVLIDSAFAYIWLGRFLKAASIAKRAFELNPNSAMNCAVYGHSLAITGHAEEGIELTRNAFMLSPRDPLEYLFHMHEGTALFFGGELGAAKRALEHSIRMKPDFVMSRLFMASILACSGQTDAAKRELSRVIQLGSENAIKNIYRPRTSGTLWRVYTDPIREIYDGELPSQPD